MAAFSSVSKILEEQSFASTPNQQMGKAETVSDRSILKLFFQTAHCLFGRGLEKGKYIVCGGDTEQELLPSQQRCTQQLLFSKKLHIYVLFSQMKPGFSPLCRSVSVEARVLSSPVRCLRSTALIQLLLNVHSQHLTTKRQAFGLFNHLLIR